jgi:predicted transcriptional regulator
METNEQSQTAPTFEDAKVADAMHPGVMASCRVHAIVVDVLNGRPVGIVSTGDVAAMLARG